MHPSANVRMRSVVVHFLALLVWAIVVACSMHRRGSSSSSNSKGYARAATRDTGIAAMQMQTFDANNQVSIPLLARRGF